MYEYMYIHISLKESFKKSWSLSLERLHSSLFLSESVGRGPPAEFVGSHFSLFLERDCLDSPAEVRPMCG